GKTLPMGTTKWSVAPRTGFKTEHIVYTHPTADGPDLFTIERETASGHLFLKAVTQTPRILWIESPAIREDEEIIDLMGESFGGVLLRVDGTRIRSSAIVRVGRPESGPL